ncbi:carbohydrate porin [Bradyrhizobium ganzhouense]|uniref:carbohydrate porin n=1 Tax=Bradyrhizobium ganzhouense TaxID=1179767 RepID=UPI003CF18634
MKRVSIIGSTTSAVLATCSLAAAADLPASMPIKASVPAGLYDWSGFYVGGQVGYGGGSLGPGTNPVPEQAVFFPHSLTGMIGGFQAGYNLQLPNRAVLGVESDVWFTGPVDLPKLDSAPFNTTLEYTATARGRIGYAFGTLLPYVTGGLAWGHTRVNINADDGSRLSSRLLPHAGWTAGIGVEMAVGGNWTTKIEYDYIELARRTYGLGDAMLPDLNVDPRIHAIKVGLNYKLGDTPSLASSATSLIDGMQVPESPDWNVHGQTTFIQQAYPRIRSPYEGTNSLPGGGQGRETLTADAFLGWRLWNGGELYFNPELAQGFGFNTTLGLAGFSNGEAQKGGTEFPKFRPQRYFIRQTFGLGGEQEEVADGPLQLAGKRDIDRVTLTVGRFAIGDFFDGNSYAKDPRADFMNWAIWSSGAYDFPADLPGITRGAVIELNRKDWALRAGVFQVPSAPNSDVLTSKGGGAVVELEERYAISDQPGKLRLGVFGNQGNTASYREALTIVASDPSLDINATAAGIRHTLPKYGFYANMEQAINTDIGIFARVSWNDGQNEILSFTDIDRSLSGGVSIKGVSWGRPSDTIGIGGAINGLSTAHRDFLAAGGNGLLIGDGRLNYRDEKILEAYYAYNLSKWSTLTFDYQFIANPAYNADRGPVSVFSARAHAEF